MKFFKKWTKVALSISIISAMLVSNMSPVMASEDEQSLTKLPGVAATSSTVFSYFNATKTIDGSVADEPHSWVSVHTGAATVKPHWMKIALPEEHNISKVVLHHFGVTGKPQFNPTSFTISVSKNDSEWETVATIQDNTFNVT